MPGAALNPIVDALERAKLLLLAEDETWVPARDPQTIELVEVLDAVRHDTAGPRLARIRDIAPAVARPRCRGGDARQLKGKTRARTGARQTKPTQLSRVRLKPDSSVAGDRHLARAAPSRCGCRRAVDVVADGDDRPDTCP